MIYMICVVTGEWNKSYVWTGAEENIYHLSVTNTILNVSSVMWRKKRLYRYILQKQVNLK